MKKPSILFVCLGNICRSPLAHGVLQHLSRPTGNFSRIDSCGMFGEAVGTPMHAGAVCVLREKLQSDF